VIVCYAPTEVTEDASTKKLEKIIQEEKLSWAPSAWNNGKWSLIYVWKIT